MKTKKQHCTDHQTPVHLLFLSSTPPVKVKSFHRQSSTVKIMMILMTMLLLFLLLVVAEVVCSGSIQKYIVNFRCDLLYTCYDTVVKLKNRNNIVFAIFYFPLLYIVL